jgi:quercetin dioxygenase-like cupin family protein
MSAEVAAEETKGPGIVLQPEEGQSYWQPIWANGYSIVKLSPKHAGPDNLAMGIQVIAPGGYVREHSHTPNQEILFCFAGKGTIIVDGVPHPFVPGTTVYAAPGVRRRIAGEGTFARDKRRSNVRLTEAEIHAVSMACRTTVGSHR